MSEMQSLNLKNTSVPSTSDRNYCRTTIRDIHMPVYNDEPVRRQMCNKCPSCIQMRNISEYSSERAPLLTGSVTLIRNSRCCDKILICLFIFVLVFVTGIATYLLILESQGAIVEEFDYVPREKWNMNSTFLVGIPPLQNPASKILILKLTPNCTNQTQNCWNYEEFLNDNSEKNSGEVLYNFYQDKNGKIFEGRGSKYQSDCGRMEGCNDILTIGLIGNSNIAPSPTQIKKLKAFLDYCIMESVLKQCYEILFKHNSDRYFKDLACTLNEMNRKDGTCEYFI